MTEDQDQLLPSKSQLKREMSALQSMGEQLTLLSPVMLDKLALPAALQDAIDEFHRIPAKHGARRRHLQYIGRVMRDVPEGTITEIRRQLEQDTLLEQRRFHVLEQLREKLLTGDNEALTELAATYPDLDLQQVRQLIRKARQESERDQPPAASRKLFRLLREIRED